MLRRRGICKGSVTIAADQTLEGVVNHHTHPISEVQSDIARVNSGIKRRAQTAHEGAQQILGVELGEISEGVSISLPHVNHIRRNIRNYRATLINLETPQSIAATPVISMEYQSTLNGNPFLLHDSGINDP